MSDTKTEKTVAEELKAAARKVRDLAAQAPEGPWGWDGPIWGEGPDGPDTTSLIVTDPGRETIATFPFPFESGHPRAEGAGPWIMMMSPWLAEPLASWLEKTAEDVTKAVYEDEICDIPGGSKDQCEADCRGHDPVLVCDECGNLLAPSGPKQGDRCRCWEAALGVARVVNGSSHG